MSDVSQTPEDIVAGSLATGLHFVGVDVVVLLTLNNGKVTRRIYGDPKKATQMAVRYAASILTETAEDLRANIEEVAQ
jgi:hypothetical protein